MGMGKACSTRLCLLKRQNSWMWPFFWAPASWPTVWWPHTACPAEGSPRLPQGFCHQPSKRLFSWPYLPCLPSIYLLSFQMNQLVNTVTFTHETNYDRIKALPAPFYKLNYWGSDWILKIPSPIIMEEKWITHVEKLERHGLLELPPRKGASCMLLSDWNQKPGVVSQPAI